MKKTFELLLLILFQKSKNIFKFKSLKVKRAKLDTLNFFIFSNSNIKQLLTTMDFHSRAYFIIFPTELFCLSALSLKPAYFRLHFILRQYSLSSALKSIRNALSEDIPISAPPHKIVNSTPPYPPTRTVHLG